MESGVFGLPAACCKAAVSQQLLVLAFRMPSKAGVQPVLSNFLCRAGFLSWVHEGGHARLLCMRSHHPCVESFMCFQERRLPEPASHSLEACMGSAQAVKGALWGSGIAGRCPTRLRRAALRVHRYTSRAVTARHATTATMQPARMPCTAAKLRPVPSARSSPQLPVASRRVRNSANMPGILQHADYAAGSNDMLMKQRQPSIHGPAA